MEIKNIASKFNFKGEYKSGIPYGSGHINDTYKIEYTEGMYILQRINTNIFTKPIELMDNIVKVTQYLKDKIQQEGGDPKRETMTVIQTKDKEYLYIDEHKGAWRAYDFVMDTVSFDLIEKAEDFRASGVCFGRFQKLLESFPIETLNYTIEKFHHTPSRFITFTKAVEDDVVGRKAFALNEIEKVMDEKEFVSTLWDYHEKGELPLKVTHNDTKLNNLLFDQDSKQAICVIDLDTVMPGFSLDDFGDSIRFGASTALEDEKDLSKVKFDMDLFETYVEGFLEGAEGSLSDLEISLFPVGAKMMTLETGMRFLTDYLQGDVYFKTTYDDHNLVRAKTQLKLVQEMNDNWDIMNAIVGKYI